jgi:hypothetical protein
VVETGKQDGWERPEVPLRPQRGDGGVALLRISARGMADERVTTASFSSPPSLPSFNSPSTPPPSYTHTLLLLFSPLVLADFLVVLTTRSPIFFPFFFFLYYFACKGRRGERALCEWVWVHLLY